MACEPFKPKHVACAVPFAKREQSTIFTKATQLEIFSDGARFAMNELASSSFRILFMLLAEKKILDIEY